INVRLVDRPEADTIQKLERLASLKCLNLVCGADAICVGREVFLELLTEVFDNLVINLKRSFSLEVKAEQQSTLMTYEFRTMERQESPSFPCERFGCFL